MLERRQAYIAVTLKGRYCNVVASNNRKRAGIRPLLRMREQKQVAPRDAPSSCKSRGRILYSGFIGKPMGSKRRCNMLDINLIREQPDLVRKALSDRQMDPAPVDRILELDARRRILLTEVEA